MQFLQPEITFDRFIRGVLFLTVVVLFVFAINWLSAVLIPFFVAWVGAWILIPVVRFFQIKCRIRSRVLAVTLSLTLFTAVIATLFRIFVPMVIEGVTHIKDATLAYLQSGNHALHLPPWMEHWVEEWIASLKLREMLADNNIFNTIRNTVPQVWDMLLSTANIVLSFVGSLIAVLYLIFFLIDYERFSKGWLGLIPQRQRRFLACLSNDLAAGMRGYFRGQALIALWNCVLFSLGFWLIDLPMPIGMGCFVGLISFVPYIQVIGFLPAALLALLQMAETGRSFWVIMLLVLLVYVVVQVIEDVIILPRVMGSIMGLSPAIILLSLSVWGFVAGIVGLMIALPVTSIMIAYYKRYVIGEENVETTPTE